MIFVSTGRITAALAGNTQFQPKMLLLSALNSATWENNPNADTYHCCAWTHNLGLMVILCNINQLVLSVSWVKHVRNHFKPWIYFCVSRYSVQSESLRTCQLWEERKNVLLQTQKFTMNEKCEIYKLDTFVLCHKVGYHAMWIQFKNIASVCMNKTIKFTVAKMRTNSLDTCPRAVSPT